MSKILKGISDANNALLIHNEISDSIQEAITHIGKATEVDRCYVFENRVNIEGDLLLFYVFEWCNTGVTPYLGDPNLSGHNYDSFPGLYETLIKDEPLFGIVSQNKNKYFKEIMEMQGILSYLFLPIFSKNSFWGWIGFDDCKSERQWNQDEINALHTVSKNIGLRLNQYFSYSRLKTALKEIDLYLDNSDQVKWVWNINNNTIEYSFNWYKLFGYTNKELPETIEKWESKIHPDDLVFFKKNLIKYQNESINKFEGILRYKNKQNEFLWVKYQAHQYFDVEQSQTKLIGSFIDISTLKNNEIEIKRQKRDYQNLSNSISEIIFKIEKDTKITFLNKKWKKYTGFENKETIGKHFLNYFEDTQDALNQYASLKHFFTKKLRKNTNRQFKVLLKTKEDLSLWVLVDINFHKYLNIFMGTITNINENEQLKQKLNKSETKFSFITNNTSDAIMVHELNGNYNFISNSSKMLIGYLPHEIQNSSPYDFIHPEDVPFIEKVHNKIIKEKTMQNANYRFKHKNGNWVWLETNVNPIIENGVVVGLISSSRDVSELKKTNEIMKEALLKEKELNKLKSNFVSMASHQFRTPLTVLYSNIELLDQVIGKDKVLNLNIKNKSINRMKNEVSRMTDLINNFLIYGKYESGQTKINFNKLNLNNLIADIIDKSFNYPITGRKIKIETVGKQKNLISDEGLLEHIFTNLISNSIKYTNKNEDPEIIIAYKTKSIVVQIIDYGIGIPEESIANLFSSFYRANNTDSIKGTGLGLVIVKEFLTLLKGDVSIESTLEIGTKVTVNLPYK